MRSGIGGPAPPFHASMPARESRASARRPCGSGNAGTDYVWIELVGALLPCNRPCSRNGAGHYDLEAVVFLAVVGQSRPRARQSTCVQRSTSAGQRFQKPARKNKFCIVTNVGMNLLATSVCPRNERVRTLNFSRRKPLPTADY